MRTILLVALLISISFATSVTTAEKSLIEACDSEYRDCVGAKCAEFGGTPQIEENETHFSVRCSSDAEGTVSQAFFDSSYKHGKETCWKAHLACIAKEGNSEERGRAACASALLFVAPLFVFARSILQS